VLDSGVRLTNAGLHRRALDLDISSSQLVLGNRKDFEELGSAALPLELPSLFSGPSVFSGSAFTIRSANATCLRGYWLKESEGLCPSPSSNRGTPWLGAAHGWGEEQLFLSPRNQAGG